MSMHAPGAGHTHAAHGGGALPASAGAGAAAIDPVCGMTVDPANTPHHAVHAGRDYHFCSARCREKFVADPAHYLQPKTQTPA